VAFFDHSDSILVDAFFWTTIFAKAVKHCPTGGHCLGNTKCSPNKDTS